MRHNRLVLAILAILVYAVPGMAQWDGDRGQARESLKGLRNVVVRVDVSSMDALPDDPTERELQATVEKRLKVAGLTVQQRASQAKDNYPTFVVSLSFMNFDIFYFQYYLHASLSQKVKLPRNPELNLTSPTWEWGTGGLVGGGTKRAQVSGIIDQFICDFRKVNPEIKGPLPDCYAPAPSLSGLGAPKIKQPSVTTELDERLIRAAALNELDEAKALVAKGAEVNARDHADRTPIVYAVRGSRKVGDAEMLRFLLANGASPNVNVACRLTPLMYAIERGDLQAIELLLDHGADPNAATAEEGYTALMAAAVLGNPEAVNLLLKKNADPRAENRQKQTAVMLAQLNRDRIAAYNRTGAEAPYITVPEETLLKQAQEKHDRVVALLKSAAEKPRN